MANNDSLEYPGPSLKAYWPFDLPNGPFVIYEGSLKAHNAEESELHEGRIAFHFHPFPVVQCEFDMDFFHGFNFDPDLDQILEEIDVESIDLDYQNETLRPYCEPNDFGQKGHVVRYFLGRRYCLGEGTQLTEIRFQLLNLPYGSGYEAVVEDNTWKAVRNRWRFEDWELVFDSIFDSSESWSAVCKQRGYAFTHTGSLTKQDNSTFDYDSTAETFDAINLFLSFWAGQRTGIALPVGISDSGTPCLVDLSVSMADPAKITRSWYSITQVIHLEELFRQFVVRYRDFEWKSVLQVVITQYTESLSGGRYIGATMTSACAGLETIVWKLVVHEEKLLTQEAYDKLDWSDCLRLILKYVGVEPNLLRSYRGDEISWPEEAKERAKSQSFLVRAANGNLSDCPEAVAWVRNRIVHPDKKNQLSAEIILESENLAKWYLELLLLYSLDYSGGHHDRVLDKPSIPVPWARSDDEGLELQSDTDTT